MQFKALEDIESLIQNRIEESVTLEYKGQLVNDNNDIAKNISAFANTEGGNIVYGIRSQDKIPISINWLVGKGIEERIQSVAMTAIQPKVDGIQVVRVSNPANDSEAVFIVNIPKSPHTPHMVLNRYYSRRGSISSPMEDIDVKSSIFGTGRVAALRYEISKNSELAERTHKLIEQIYVLSPERRQPIVLIPFHTDAWSAIIASGLLYSLKGTLAERLVEAYGLIHEINSLIAWLNMHDITWRHLHTPSVVHTPVDPSSARGGTYLPAVIRDRLPKLLSLLKEVEGLLPF